MILASEIPANTPTDYTQFTRNATFRGLRLGVPRLLFFDSTYVDQEMIYSINNAIHKIKSLGAFIQDPADLPSIYELATSNAEILVIRTNLF
jgi:amidase